MADRIECWLCEPVSWKRAGLTHQTPCLALMPRSPKRRVSHD